MNLGTIWPASWLALENFWRPVCEHLWQTTLFAAVAALLSMLLKKNRAPVRYTLWLIASLKFLVPFSLLVTAGNYFSWLQAPGIESPEILFLIRGPFGAGMTADVASASSLTLAARLAPAILLMMSAIGAAAVMAFWWLRWRRTMAIVRTAAPLTAGREFDILRGLENANGMKRSADLVTAAIPLSISVESLREQMQLRTGELVNISAAHAGIERIQKLYSAKNFEAEVRPEIAIDDQRQIIDVVFRVKETPNGNSHGN